MNRTEKIEAVQALKDILNASEIVVVTAPHGLTVAESRSLRGKMREAGGQFMVVKNTLARLALKDTAFESITDQLRGPIAFGVSEDVITAPKVLAAFAKENEKLKIVCGATTEEFLDLQRVSTLATLPSLDELRSKLVGLLQAPATKLATVTQAPAGDLARVLKARSDQLAA